MCRSFHFSSITKCFLKRQLQQFTVFNNCNRKTTSPCVVINYCRLILFKLKTLQKNEWGISKTVSVIVRDNVERLECNYVIYRLKIDKWAFHSLHPPVVVYRANKVSPTCGYIVICETRVARILCNVWDRQLQPRTRMWCEGDLIATTQLSDNNKTINE